MPQTQPQTRTLVLIRHAKSSWDDPNMRDFDRPINERGQHDAPDMGHDLRRGVSDRTGSIAAQPEGHGKPR